MLTIKGEVIAIRIPASGGSVGVRARSLSGSFLGDEFS